MGYLGFSYFPCLWLTIFFLPGQVPPGEEKSPVGSIGAQAFVGHCQRLEGWRAEILLEIDPGHLQGH